MTVKLAEMVVGPPTPVGSNVKVPLIVSVEGGTVGKTAITGGVKLYVIGAAVAGDGVARIAGVANAIATQRPSKLVSNALRCCDWRHRVVIAYVPLIMNHRYYRNNRATLAITTMRKASFRSGGAAGERSQTKCKEFRQGAGWLFSVNCKYFQHVADRRPA